MVQQKKTKTKNYKAKGNDLSNKKFHRRKAGKKERCTVAFGMKGNDDGRLDGEES